MKARQLKKKAKEALKGKYWWSVLVAMITSLFGAISISGCVSGAALGGLFSGATNAATEGVLSEAAPDTALLEESLESLFSMIPDGVWAFIGVIVVVLLILLAISMIISLIIAIIGSAVRLGYNLYNIELYTGKKPSIDLVFSRLDILIKAFWLDVVIGIKVALWTLLFIIPGIVAAFRYAMADYILAENPDISVREAIKRSCKIMKGNKWKFFWLDFSFIGWGILAAIIPFGELLLTPYKQAAYAAFYIDKSGRFVIINDQPKTAGTEAVEEAAEPAETAESDATIA